MSNPQFSINKVLEHMLRTTATPGHVIWHKLKVILVNKILCSKLKMRLVELMVMALTELNYDFISPRTDEPNILAFES